MTANLASVVLPVTLALTSLATYALGRRLLGLPPGQLRTAIGMMLECVGLVTAFFCFNLLAGGALVLLLRLLPVKFVALYALTDLILLPLSLVQALVLFSWRIAAASGRPVAAPPA